MITPALVIDKYALAICLLNLSDNLKLAAQLTLAYSKGEADAWCSADKHYGKKIDEAFNEGVECGSAEERHAMRHLSYERRDY